MIHVEAIGANGVPPSQMAFQVMIDGEHLKALLTSAASMPDGQRSVPRHLKDALTVLLTDTAGVPQSDAGTNEASSTPDTAAPTPSAKKSSKARTLKDLAVEDDVDVPPVNPVAKPAVDVPLPL
jgi:hypothetical protein